MKNMKKAYRNVYRLYLVLCMGIGIFLQYGRPHPDYFMGWFYGLICSWIGPGMVVKGLAHLFSLAEIGVPGMLAISAVFWVLFFSLAKQSPRDSTARPRPGRGFAVDTSGHVVMPNLPPGLGYYPRRDEHTTRTAYYLDEEG